jgi:hypothetical protein
LSEKYILAPQRGSIGFLANTHFGIPPFLNFYNTNFYNNFSKNLYGNTVGNQVKEVLASLGASNPNLDYYTRIHLEEIALHGDPAIKIYHSEKPDYAIEDPMVLVSPNIISVFPGWELGRYPRIDSPITTRATPHCPHEITIPGVYSQSAVPGRHGGDGL